MLNKLLLLTKKYKNDKGADVMSDPLFLVVEAGDISLRKSAVISQSIFLL